MRQLVQTCDVFIENYKVGDMARYGLDYDTLALLNPKLVYCSITGFGQTGPYRHRAGYDFAIQGMGGLMSITGERDELGGSPQKAGIAVADLFTGMYATVAILAALRHAAQTGEGQHIDMALLDTQVAVIANLGANYLVSGQHNGTVPTRAGNAHQNLVPYQILRSRQLRMAAKRTSSWPLATIHSSPNFVTSRVTLNCTTIRALPPTPTACVTATPWFLC